MNKENAVLVKSSSDYEPTRKRKRLSYATEQLLGIKNTYISTEDWAKMSYEEKDNVRAIRARLKKNRLEKQKNKEMASKVAEYEISTFINKVNINRVTKGKPALI